MRQRVLGLWFAQRLRCTARILPQPKLQQRHHGPWRCGRRYGQQAQFVRRFQLTRFLLQPTNTFGVPRCTGSQSSWRIVQLLCSTRRQPWHGVQPRSSSATADIRGRRLLWRSACWRLPVRWGWSVPGICTLWQPSPPAFLTVGPWVLGVQPAKLRRERRWWCWWQWKPGHSPATTTEPRISREPTSPAGPTPSLRRAGSDGAQSPSTNVAVPSSWHGISGD